jgi:PAS domain S-box-containing protein
MHFARLPEELPVEAAREKEYCRQTGFKSHLAIPFKVADHIIGSLGFGCFGRSYEWSDGLVASLQLVGEIFANALARQRADLALREREARFRLLSDAAPVMVWMSGRDKRCTYFNKPWLDFTGRPLARELGDGWSEGVHPGDLQGCLNTYGCAFEARQDFRMEYRLQRSDGEYRWILDTGVPRFDADGTFEGYIGSCIDITEQKRGAEETLELRDQLARVGRFMTLGELAASIAHEVNQPLCGVISNAQTVQRVLGKVPVDFAEVRDAVADIVADGQRASAILGRIRGLLQKTPAERTALDVGELIQAVCAVLRSEVLRRSVAMTLELAQGLPRVQGDRVQLQQVILNLMTNGMDAMDCIAPEHRELVIRSSVDETGNVMVAVTDMGKGLKGQTPDQLFKALYTTKPDSIGMGLAICKSIIDSHGGRISASQNPDWGATFSFSLPGIPEGVS